MLGYGLNEWGRYNEIPECGYKSDQLNFAMHVRMGDRRAIQGGLNDDYFVYLQKFMDDVTEAVVSKGLESPMFHIYTQTLFPCPSRTTGLFKEFPLWPVEMDQVRLVMSRVYWISGGNSVDGSNILILDGLW